MIIGIKTHFNGTTCRSVGAALRGASPLKRLATVGLVRSSLMALFFAFFAKGALAIPIISLLPDPEKIHNVPPPRNFSVEINISGIPTGTFLGAFELDFTFDSNVFVFQPALGSGFGPGLGNPSAGEAVGGVDTSVPGTISLFEVSLLEADAATCVFCISPFLEDLQGPSFTLGTLTFGVVAPAPPFVPGGPRITVIDTSNIVLSDQNGIAFADSNNPALPIGNPPTAVKVSEPGTLVLFGVGFTALAFMTRRRKRVYCHVGG